MKRRKFGFTVVELLIVLGIISLLVGMLIPALTAVRNKAKETKQRGQFTAIEVALTVFKNDHGDYPPSDWALPPDPSSDYCGAQKLAEALLGWDLLGFHPDTAWRADGYDGITANGPLTYDPDRVRDDDGDGVPDTFGERKGPYLELATTSAFRLGDVFGFGPTDAESTRPLAPGAFVLCDVFGKKRIILANGEAVRAGAPILYYRANASGQAIRGRYNVSDNDALVQAKQQVDGREHPLSRSADQFQFFYDYIRDPKIDTRLWPYRPDSYILISAGADGVYGTGDDIRNFGN